MEQRTYHGSITAEGLADYLVDRFNPMRNVQAQKLGTGEGFLVQVGLNDDPDKMKHAVTVGIASAPDGDGVCVTMGQQQWLTPDEAGHAALWGLLGMLVTPWALFMLIWPLKDILAATPLPGQLWDAVEVYAGSQGATLGGTELLAHPHA